jgi:poly-D-alanine transfer protein DltD
LQLRRELLSALGSDPFKDALWEEIQSTEEEIQKKAREASNLYPGLSIDNILKNNGNLKRIKKEVEPLKEREQRLERRRELFGSRQEKMRGSGQPRYCDAVRDIWRWTDDPLERYLKLQDALKRWLGEESSSDNETRIEDCVWANRNNRRTIARLLRLLQRLQRERG